ncbi:MAG: hypothetical protein HY332_09420 [Chloroflexi bacterium]|nr:hypothetical protein [Chloroflexota bacterium]
MDLIWPDSVAPRPAERPPAACRFGALRHRDFTLFWMSVITSNTGYWMQLVAAFALSTWYPLSVALLVGVGAMNFAFGATASTLLQTIAPNAPRGRIMSLYTLCFLGLSPLGAGFIGPIADLTGAPAAILAGALVVALAALTLALTRPDVRALE